MIIDTHAHYDDERFDTDRDELLLKLQEMHMIAVNACTDRRNCEVNLQMVEKYACLYGMIGIYPEYVDQHTDADLNRMKEMASHPKIVSIGEIGLDYHWEENPPKEVQIEWFRKQIRLAKEVHLPINVHSRDAAEDTLDVIRSENAKECGGIIHCFSYSPEIAREYVKLGFYLGIGGVVTFSNAKKLKEVVKAVPVENIVTETDCPYLAPVPHRGERNSSLYLPAVLEAIAGLKGLSTEEVERITEENARKVYGI
ncbi:MAG: TatD family hydrolase [Lachnospiraceae bacterium]|nr:TatD family hydrolase [Lachnospiraceae bacterium]